VSDIKTTPVLVCVEHIRTSLQSIALLKKKILFVTDQESLMDQAKGVGSLPACGIIYDGMRAVGETGSGRTGGMAEMVFSLVLINRDTDIVSTDQTKNTSILILDQMRALFLDKISPTGHRWKFVVEAAAAENKGTVFWVQRWQAPVGLMGRS
jgi:hypothetical protein